MHLSLPLFSLPKGLANVLLGTDIINTLFKYRVSYRHLPFMIEIFKL